MTAAGARIVRGVDRASEGYGAPTVNAGGSVASRFVHPPGHSLWLVDAEALAGASLAWGVDHGDEAVFLVSGAIELGGRTWTGPSAVVVERTVGARMDVLAPARWLHLGSASEMAPAADDPLGAPTDVGLSAHGRSADDAWLYEVSREGARVITRYWYDSSLPTTRTTLLSVSFPPGYRAPSHRHTADELISVLSGSLAFAGSEVGPGDTLAIPADTLYGFTVGAEGCEFVNYRARESYYVPGDRTKPRYLEVMEVMRSLPVERGSNG